MEEKRIFLQSTERYEEYRCWASRVVYYGRSPPEQNLCETSGLSISKIGEKRGEMLAKVFTDCRPSISRESGRKKFHTSSSTRSGTARQQKKNRIFEAGGGGALGAEREIVKKRVLLFFGWGWGNAMRVKF